jgi:hypothetical protein
MTEFIAQPLSSADRVLLHELGVCGTLATVA